MNTNEIRTRILEESRRSGITLTEDELNAKVLEVSRMDPEKLERLSGGGQVFNCVEANFCMADYMCVIFNN